MVITKLIGGLGNQMFQYAAGRALANKLDAKLKVDATAFKTYKLHAYGLDCFKAQIHFATEKEVNSFKQPSQLPPVRLPRFIGNIFKIPPQKNIVCEKHFHFDPCFFKVKEDAYLQGFWVSEKYFQNIADIIRKDFKFKHPLIDKNKQLMEKIKELNSISIHVRRGDYVSDKAANEFHGTCSLGYYQRCVALIVQRIENPVFFIFSDDPGWTKQNLKPKFPTIYVSDNQNKNYEDLQLMSCCKHNIIANSTFSWWAAWLNNNSDRIVLVPKKWFNKAPYNTKDLIPKSWERIKSNPGA